MSIFGEGTEKLVRQSMAVLSHYSGLNAVRNSYRQFTLGPKVIVLAYHRVNESRDDESPYTVTRSQLDEQLDILGRRFCVVGFSEVLDMAAGKRECSDSAVITFDDGYRDNYENAAPILEKHGMQACFFLTTNLVDGLSAEEGDGAGQWGFPGMTWKQAKSLHDRGFELGAHSRSHPCLPDIRIEEAAHEIVESRERMQDALEVPVQYFAYPGGKKHLHYNDAIRQIVAGEFDVCCTTDRGRNSLRILDPLDIRRICVQRWWSQYYFRRELDGTFDFVGSRTLTTRKG